MGTRNDLSEDLRSGATENRNIMNISGAVLPKEKSVCHLWPVARPYGTLIAMIITIMQGVQHAPIINERTAVSARKRRRWLISRA
jgi:hypothetical protein